MFWTAPIPAWVVLLMVIVLAAFIVYFARLATNWQRAAESSTEGKQRTIDALVKERDGVRDTLKARDLELAALHGENAALHARITGMSESLGAAQAEVERLIKMTLPLQEDVKPVEPPPGVLPDYLNTLEATFPPKHSTRKKRGAQQ
jgi:hypothetical protein